MPLISSLSPGNVQELHPYLAMERDVLEECNQEKEKLKQILKEAAQELASKQYYSPLAAKAAATDLVRNKLEPLIQEMQERTPDIDKKEMIATTWRSLSPELYSPFSFKKILEQILTGQS